MSRDVYRYYFPPPVPLDEVAASLALARLALEGLHGAARVRLDLRHVLDPGRRTCEVEAASAVGRAFNRVFAEFLRREFGPDAFHVERVRAARGASAT